MDAVLENGVFGDADIVEEGSARVRQAVDVDICDEDARSAKTSDRSGTQIGWTRSLKTASLETQTSSKKVPRVYARPSMSTSVMRTPDPRKPPTGAALRSDGRGP